MVKMAKGRDLEVGDEVAVVVVAEEAEEALDLSGGEETELLAEDFHLVLDELAEEHAGLEEAEEDLALLHPDGGVNAELGLLLELGDDLDVGGLNLGDGGLGG